jgi:hypothetical protein
MGEYLSAKPPLRITVTYTDGGWDNTGTYRDAVAVTTHVYAVDENTLRDAQIWAAKKKHSVGKELDAWLFKKGCKLDSSDGPAITARFADGTTQVEYYRDGLLHREDGPASIYRSADGMTVEQYYRNGKLLKEERLAPLSSILGVTVERPALDVPNKPAEPGPS